MSWIVDLLTDNFVLSSVIVGVASCVAVWLLGQRRGSRRIRRSMHAAFLESEERRLAQDAGKADGDAEGSSEESGQEADATRGVKILFGTQTGGARQFALRLQKLCRKERVEAEVQSLAEYDPEESLHKEERLLVFIVSTYAEGGPPDSARWFHRWLGEAAVDFRVGASHLRRQRFAVVGLGHSAYKDNFNRVAREVDAWLRKLSASAVLPVALLDENAARSEHGGLEEDFAAWCETFQRRWLAREEPQGADAAKEEGCCGSGDCQCSATTPTGPPEEQEEQEEDEDEEANKENEGLVDLEDLGKFIGAAKEEAARKGPREMITPLLRKSLEKQGYRLLGTHSGVKMCRWTKSMLRGRGGCYKHSFYGIASHQCMEATPSLACANKCVFCWRHHTNPVGTEWRWRTDPPQAIFEQALSAHRGLVRQFRGVPGVRDDRFQEGLRVRHCALSLVGEPIMYPHIGELVRLLHASEISSFLVTNAQFPDAIRTLCPVTQLYVSVDAASKDSLKKIDRPLFRDFWERLIDSLKALAEKGQRTVFRLTLVKAWNTEELDGYASLVEIGNPDFVEVKGVTYCGDSKASSLTMQNVPWHQEVLDFCRQLTDRLASRGYAIACEHEHSNCVLIAHSRFRMGNRWHTWIDYARFHDLFRRWEASGGVEAFASTDYMAPTPEWALVGAEERGFDPGETRFRKERRKAAADDQ